MILTSPVSGYSKISRGGQEDWISKPSMTAMGAGFHDSVAGRISKGISSSLNRRNGVLYMNDHCTMITDQYSKRSHGLREEFQMFHDRQNIHAETYGPILTESTRTIQFHRRGTQDKCLRNFSISPDGNRGSANREDRSSLKRKAPDGDIDLNLSLNTRSRRDEGRKVALDEEVELPDNNLSLSLSCPLKKVNYSIDLNMP